MFKVFVYGSLKKGFHNHYFLENSKLLGKGILKGATLYDMGISYPCMKIDKSDNVIYGEVYEVDFETLCAIDYLEGYNPGSSNNLYNRQTVVVNMENGDSNVCYSYEWAHEKRNHWKEIEEWTKFKRY